MFKRYLYRNYASAGWMTRRFAGRITMGGRIVVCATLITAALGTDTTVSVAYQAFSVLLFIVLASLLGLFWSKRRISYRRILPRFGSVGEPLPYVALVRNESRRGLRSLCVCEVVEDTHPTLDQFLNLVEPGEEKRNGFDRLFGFYRWRWLMKLNTRLDFGEMPLPDLPPGAEREVRMELMPRRRGPARLTGVMVLSPEPLGLFRAICEVPAAQSVLILPRRYPVAPFDLPGTVKYQQGGVSLASSVGESEEFVSLRDYRPGDPLRHVHWKSFAKAGRPVVKEFQDEFFVRHALILDTFGRQSFDPMFEEAVSVAASLACTLEDHDSLLDLMFIGPQAYCFTMGRGVGHIEQMLEILASVQPCLDKGFDSLESLTQRHMAQLSGVLCVLLDWDESRKRFIQRLRTQGIPLKVFVITESESKPGPIPAGANQDGYYALPVNRVAERLASL